jgi:hypothetical protein
MSAYKTPRLAISDSAYGLSLIFEVMAEVDKGRCFQGWSGFLLSTNDRHLVSSQHVCE